MKLIQPLAVLALTSKLVSANQYLDPQEPEIIWVCEAPNFTTTLFPTHNNQPQPTGQPNPSQKSDESREPQSKVSKKSNAIKTIVATRPVTQNSDTTQYETLTLKPIYTKTTPTKITPATKASATICTNNKGEECDCTVSTQTRTLVHTNVPGSDKVTKIITEVLTVPATESSYTQKISAVSPDEECDCTVLTLTNTVVRTGVTSYETILSTLSNTIIPTTPLDSSMASTTAIFADSSTTNKFNCTTGLSITSTSALVSKSTSIGSSSISATSISAKVSSTALSDSSSVSNSSISGSVSATSISAKVSSAALSNSSSVSNSTISNSSTPTTILAVLSSVSSSDSSVISNSTISSSNAATSVASFAPAASSGFIDSTQFYSLREGKPKVSYNPESRSYIVVVPLYLSTKNGALLDSTPKLDDPNASLSVTADPQEPNNYVLLYRATVPLNAPVTKFIRRKIQQVCLEPFDISFGLNLPNGLNIPIIVEVNDICVDIDDSLSIISTFSTSSASISSSIRKSSVVESLSTVPSAIKSSAVSSVFSAVTSAVKISSIAVSSPTIVSSATILFAAVSSSAAFLHLLQLYPMLNLHPMFSLLLKFHRLLQLHLLLSLHHLLFLRLLKLHPMLKLHS
ncbi:hypothetical protein NADFUDRAFT_71453 [Nadsonia fulvescens var. elongata DSM 6958]|uniref:Uncharacterized protein n=1 Tax=Nadsonia fulvescens var. elongata DSM 6958 TaxID=857566 RepID=A0A1E3PEE1_9ASCO|nr:hypothetical protein NADFUDRAFT_71453 [Nadsonia fulvescens var. elongata DSM 6958]